MEPSDNTWSVSKAALATSLVVMAGCADVPKNAAFDSQVRPYQSASSSMSRIDGFYYSAVAAIERRDYVRALEALQEGRAIDPADVRILNAFGVVYDKLGRFDLSARYYGQARAIDAASPVVEANMAYSARLRGYQLPSPAGDMMATAPAAPSATEVSVAEAAPAAPPPETPRLAVAQTSPRAAPAQPERVTRPAPVIPALAAQSRPAALAPPAPPPIQPQRVAAAPPATRPAPPAPVASAPIVTASAQRAIPSAPAPAVAPPRPTAASTRPVQVAASPPRPTTPPNRVVAARPAAPARVAVAPSRPVSVAAARPQARAVAKAAPVVAPRPAGRPFQVARAPAPVKAVRPPLYIVNASGQTGRGEPIRFALASKGWSTPRWALQQGPAQAKTVIHYPPARRPVAMALAMTLPGRTELAPCNCAGLKLVLGADAKRWRPMAVSTNLKSSTNLKRQGRA